MSENPVAFFLSPLDFVCDTIFLRSHRELKDLTYKDATEFVKTQLVAGILNGAWFHIYSQKGKGKGYRFYKLSPNKKFLHYAEFQEMTALTPTLEHLPQKVELANCSDIAIGQMSPLFATKKGKPEEMSLAFSLMSLDAESSLADFMAESNMQFAEWSDGYAPPRPFSLSLDFFLCLW